MKFLFVNTDPLTKRGIGQALTEMGHEAHYLFLAGENSLEPFLRAVRPDYVFTEGGYDLLAKIFPLVQDSRIPHIYWATEDPLDFYSLSLPFARQSSYVFTTCRESISEYRKYGVEAHLLMFACLPSVHHTANPEGALVSDIAFAGNPYMHAARVRGLDMILRPLLERDYDVKVYGREEWLKENNYLSIPPSKYGGYLPNNYLPQLCASARIILGLHSVDNSLTMMSMRTFEVLGSGGFYLTQWTPAVEKHFINHHHLVWSKNARETVDLVNYYLDRPGEREAIARQGQAHVYAHHTYHHRAQDMLNILQGGRSARFFNKDHKAISIQATRRFSIRV